MIKIVGTDKLKGIILFNYISLLLSKEINENVTGYAISLRLFGISFTFKIGKSKQIKYNFNGIS